jgi:hypothetical protein
MIGVGGNSTAGKALDHQAVHPKGAGMMRIFDVIKLPFAVAGAFVGALGLAGCWDAIKGCLAEARGVSRT